MQFMCPSTLEWKIEKGGGYLGGGGGGGFLQVKYSADRSLHETKFTCSLAPLFSVKGKQKRIISSGILCHGDCVIGMEGTLNYYFDSLF
jgi:hypothetical protein